MFAILLNAFAPSLSHAVAARLGVDLLEICTKDGLKRIVVDRRDARPDVPPGAHVVASEHCLYCAPHGATYAHTPSSTLAPAIVGAAAPAVEPRAHSAQVIAWTGAHARAPPRHS